VDFAHRKSLFNLQEKSVVRKTWLPELSGTRASALGQNLWSSLLTANNGRSYALGSSMLVLVAYLLQR